VTAPTLIDRLAAHKTVGSAPRQELEWLAAHGTLRLLAEGDVLTPKGLPVTGLFLILTGQIAIYLDRGAGRHKVMEWRDGDVTGLLPYSRLVSPPGDTVAQGPSEVFAIPRERLVEMIHACHEVTSILVHKMLDRSRIFTTSGLHDEKMASLGKLSAGLAHELNNPAAAIERSAALLDDRLDDAEQAARALNGAALSEAQFAALDQVRTACGATAVAGVLSPIQRAEREDAIADWLSAHGIDESIAGPLGETAVTLEALDAVASAVEGPALSAGLRFVAAGCSVRSLASEIQEAAMRISGLVAAVKGFTHMDQAAVAEPVDLRASLANTVAVLNAKARSKSVAVSVAVPADLPKARGFAGELNQIWANLIDNALDAVPVSGRVEVSAACERQRVVVRVADNGAGIPEDVKTRMFEPFFTTKPVGKGTGLGLDIVRRLLTHNDADIEVDSVPGRTEFRVSLPLADASVAGGPSAGGPDVPKVPA
jgi:signal transduction histidine kinase